MPVTVTTPKSAPRQLRLRRPDIAHYRVSFGSVFSAFSSSSQEEQNSIFLPEGEREKRNLHALNSALNIISDGKFEPLPRHIDIEWDALSERTRNEYTGKAKDVVTLFLATIAPCQEKRLWQAIIDCHESQVTSEVIRPILLAYKECDNTSTKTQILSIICNKYSQSQIQEFLPGISLRQIKNARKHAQEHGPGEPIVKKQIFSMQIGHGKGEGVRLLHFKVYLSARCCIWNKNTQTFFWGISSNPSSCPYDDDDQNCASIPGGMQA